MHYRSWIIDYLIKKYSSSIWSGVVVKHLLHVLSPCYTATGVDWSNLYRLLACSDSIRKTVNEESDDFFIRKNHSSSAGLHSSPHLFLSYIQDIENT